MHLTYRMQNKEIDLGKHSDKERREGGREKGREKERKRGGREKERKKERKKLKRHISYFNE